MAHIRSDISTGRRWDKNEETKMATAVIEKATVQAEQVFRRNREAEQFSFQVGRKEYLFKRGRYGKAIFQGVSLIYNDQPSASVPTPDR